MVGRDYLISYDKYYNDPRFPKWNIDDVLPAPRSLLFYGGKKYMVASDHDGQIMCFCGIGNSSPVFFEEECRACRNSLSGAESNMVVTNGNAKAEDESVSERWRFSVRSNALGQFNV